MKKLSIYIVALACILSACTVRENAWNTFYSQEKKLTEIEAALIYANSQVNVIYTIAKTISSTSVNFIEKVDTLGADGVRITFHNGEKIIIKNGEDGANNYQKGIQGTSGYVPTLGIKQDGTSWYWTADGSYISVSGSRLVANPDDASYGTQPQLTIEDGNWYFKYTDTSGSSQSVLIGPSSSSEQRYFIKSFALVEGGKYARLTFVDGTSLDIPTYNSDTAVKSLCDEINANMSAFRTAVISQKAGDYVAESISVLDGAGDRGCELIFRDGTSARLRKALPDGEESSLKAPLISAVMDGEEWYWTVNGTRSSLVSGELPVVSVRDSLQKTCWFISGAGEIAADTQFKSAVVDDILFESKYITVTVTNTSSTLALDRASLDEVKTISIVPDAGGKAVAVSAKTNYVKLLVKPSSAAGVLSQSKSSKFIFDVGYYSGQSKTDTASIELKYQSCDLTEGTVTYSFSGKKIDPSFFSGMLAANASFRLIDEQRTLLSDYIQLCISNGSTDLSKNVTSNCYIVDDAGIYLFNARYKGNSKSETVGDAKTADVLWESFGTDVVPQVGSIVEKVSIENGYVTFITPDELSNGNAVIAVRDASGNILWSWHIWACKDFDADACAQEYNNNAGRVMDRNLGATSATPGDVHALGLIYQWGRKDPFLSGNSISNSSQAASTISWPSAENAAEHLENNTTLKYSLSHPTTFLKNDRSYPYDWYCTSDVYQKNDLWSSDKSIYDPCPAGWRVLDGGSSGVWSTAFGTSSSYSDGPWDDTNKGMNFGSDNGKSSSMQLGSASTIWYPAAGYRDRGDGSLCSVGYDGSCWSCTPNGYDAYYLSFLSNGDVSPLNGSNRASGRSVRCISESSPKIVPVQKVELSHNRLEVPLEYPAQLEATVLPSDANVRTVKWSSDDPSIADVDEKGNISAKKVGECTISATSTVNSSAVGSCKVIVFDPGDLTAVGNANSYIVSLSANYRMSTKYKGNSSTETIDNASSAEVLWESFGSDTKPEAGSLINNLQFRNDSVFFTVNSPIKEGNAVIAVKDASDNILWSWHIWLCKDYTPSVLSVKYRNGAGSFMDRNLGALTTKTGIYTDIGLLYQWGRKDPFPGSSSFVSARKAATTPDLPDPVQSDVSTGTVEYSLAHPSTFIKSVGDWCQSKGAERWSEGNKGIYDPCPPGWKLPAGGVEGCWTIARGWPGEWTDGKWDNTYIGMSVQGLMSDSESWYPAAGKINGSDASISGAGEYAFLWTSSSLDTQMQHYSMAYPSTYNTNGDGVAGNAYSVRCISDDGTSIIPLSSLKFSSSQIKIDKGNSLDLKTMLLFEPSNANLKAVKWSGGSPNLELSDDGVITAKTRGICIVEATSYNGLKAELTVVVNVPVTGVTLDKSSHSLAEGNSFKLNATITPSDASNTSLVWFSSDDAVAVVSEDGTVTCKTKGNAVITVRTEDGGFTAECAVTVLRDGKDGNHEGAGTEDWGI